MPLACQWVNRFNRQRASSEVFPQTYQVRADRVHKTLKHLRVAAEPFLRRAFPFLRRAFPFRESGKAQVIKSTAAATELSRWELTCLVCVSSTEEVQPNGTLAMLIAQHA